MSLASAARPIVAVFGATGAQGGAVFRALSATNHFHVRGITRNPQSESAQKLLASVSAEHQKHVELVAGDLDDESSLSKAFSGAWGAFVVTQFWDPKVGVKEEEQAKRAAQAAYKAGVRAFLYSSLADAHSISGGRHQVHHFTGKNRAEKYIRDHYNFAECLAFPYAGTYASNYLTMMAPKLNEKDSVYEFFSTVRSDVALPIVDIEEEFGAAVVEVFKNPKKFNGQVIYTGKYYTMDDWVEAFTSGTGKPARYVQLPSEAGKSFGEEVYDMLEYFNHNGYYGGINIKQHQVVKSTDAVHFWKKHAKKF